MTTDDKDLVERLRAPAGEFTSILDRAEAADRIEQLSSGGWMPIESAPKDGSNILIIAMEAYSPEARQGWWDGTWWAFYSRPEKFVVPGPTHMIEVTHWQPLPSPPALQSLQVGGE
jgi:hypothetical protein